MKQYVYVLSMSVDTTFNAFLMFYVYSVHVRYKIFLSAIEYLPFSPGDDVDNGFEKGSFEEIVERFLTIILKLILT